MTMIVGRDDYYETAFEVLAESGFQDLRIGRMCRELGVTSGSFYHHFGNWQGFVGAFLDFWEHRQSTRLQEMRFGTAGPERDLAALVDLTLNLQHRAEAAIRAWSMNDVAVREAQRRVDHARHRTVRNAIVRLVGDTATAAVIASLGTAMLIGHQQLIDSTDHAEWEKLAHEFVRLIDSHRREPAPGDG